MTTQIHPQPETEQDVLGWLTERAKVGGRKVPVRLSIIKRDGRWLHIAVGMPGLTDVMERAKLLLALEDAWDGQKPRPYWKLLLIPAAG
jgi:hypothetical protein